MNFISRYLRSVLLSESELESLRNVQSLTSNIMKDTTMRLIQSGPHLSEQQSSTLLANAPEVKKLVVKTALTKLLDDAHFSICSVDSILNVLEVSRDTPAYKQLSALHCVKYADMPMDLKALLPSLLNEAMRGLKNTEHVDMALRGVV